MHYYLKESHTTDDGLYVGSHSKTQCQLQILAYAVSFKTIEEAENSKRNLEDFCGLKLKVIELEE